MLISCAKPLETEFNQSRAKTNDNYSKLSASDPHESKLDIGQRANFVTASEQKAIKAIFVLNGCSLALSESYIW